MACEFLDGKDGSRCGVVPFDLGFGCEKRSKPSLCDARLNFRNHTIVVKSVSRSFGYFYQSAFEMFASRGRFLCRLNETARRRHSDAFVRSGCLIRPSPRLAPIPGTAPESILFSTKADPLAKRPTKKCDPWTRPNSYRLLQRFVISNPILQH